MGSATVQEKLWSRQPGDWAAVQEQTSVAAYNYVLNKLKLSDADNVLDVGCGTGLFSAMAAATGANVTGIDATAALLNEAGKRTQNVVFSTAEMEELPFAGSTFDVVCGFNSFQYAANVLNALKETFRVLKPGGKLVCMIWGNKEQCEAATYLKAAGSLMPPPPPGAPGPFALSENGMLEKLVSEAGFNIITSADMPWVWDYPDMDTAMRGLLSAGPVTRAIEHSGFEKVYETLKNAVEPFVKNDGRVIYVNKFRVVFGGK